MNAYFTLRILTAYKYIHTIMRLKENIIRATIKNNSHVAFIGITFPTNFHILGIVHCRHAKDQRKLN